MAAPNDNAWPEERIERLRQLWAEGYTTVEIGNRLGVSKNAIVGKARRLPDMEHRPSPIRPLAPGQSYKKPERKRPLKTAPLPVLRSDTVPKPRPIRVVAPKFVPPAPPIMPAPVVTIRLCAFPMWGDVKPTHEYCGNRRAVGAYCLEHARICYGRAPRREELAA